jgi:PIN domain nuclease of toxin-antitoxin system
VRLLLDTHIVLWWLSDSPRLAKRSKKLIAGNAEVFVSAATAWEIAIKKSLGKLKAPDDLEAALAASRFQELPVSVRHALAAGELARHHDDPFDRLLVAQAQAEDLTLLTSDARLDVYGAKVLLNTV